MLNETYSILMLALVPMTMTVPGAEENLINVYCLQGSCTETQSHE